MLCPHCSKFIDIYASRIYDRIIPEPNSGCWLWIGGHDPKTGYGTARYPKDGINKVQPVHRIVYELEKGPIPDKMDLDHLCRNPACVNPDHLEPVTHKENMIRGVGPERSRIRMQGNQHWKKRKVLEHSE